MTSAAGGTGWARYAYLADGTKMYRNDMHHDGHIYRGSFVYRLEGGVQRLESIGYEEGRIMVTGHNDWGMAEEFIDTWHVTDHLGNVRAVVDITDIQRWTTPDPLAEKYYDLSPYAFCNNNPVNFVDPDGRNIFIYDIENQQFKKYEWKSVGDIWGFYDENDQIYSGSNDFINAASNALKDLMGTNTGKNIVAQLTGLPHDIFIVRGMQSAYDSAKKWIGWNYDSPESVPVTNGLHSNATINLIHEMAHALYSLSGGEKKTWFTIPTMKGYRDIDISEIYTTHIENLIRSYKSYPLRTYYSIYQNGNPCGPSIVNPRTRESRYYKSNGSTNYKRINKKDSPYVY